VSEALMRQTIHAFNHRVELGERIATFCKAGVIRHIQPLMGIF